MKKLLLSIALLILILDIDAACGGEVNPPAQSGVAAATTIPLHGHTGIFDGGILNAPVLFIIYNGQASITSGADTLTSWFSETGNIPATWYNAGTATFNPKQAGSYIFTHQICGYCVTTTTMIGAKILKNGSLVQQGYLNLSFTPNVQSCMSISWAGSFNGTTDYINTYSIITGTGTCQTTGAGALTIMQF